MMKYSPKLESQAYTNMFRSMRNRTITCTVNADSECVSSKDYYSWLDDVLVTFSIKISRSKIRQNFLTDG